MCKGFLTFAIWFHQSFDDCCFMTSVLACTLLGCLVVCVVNPRSAFWLCLQYREVGLLVLIRHVQPLLRALYFCTTTLSFAPNTDSAIVWIIVAILSTLQSCLWTYPQKEKTKKFCNLFNAIFRTKRVLVHLVRDVQHPFALKIVYIPAANSRQRVQNSVRSGLSSDIPDLLSELHAVIHPKDTNVVASRIS